MQFEKGDNTLVIKPDSIRLSHTDPTKQVTISNGILEISGGIIDISYNNDPNTRFIVSNTGQVGISVDTLDQEKLKVNGNVSINAPNDYQQYPLQVTGYHNAGTLQAKILLTDDISPLQTITNAKISMKVDRSIWVADGGVLVSSDKRIKTNIEPIDDKSALNIINNIQTYKYNYKTDPSGSIPVYGYIAQEVKQQLPYAVTLIKNFIPSVLKPCEINSKTNNTVEIILNNIPDDTNNTGRYLFYCYKTDNNNEYREEVLGEKIDGLRVKCILPDGYSNYFCYGWEIDDFNILNKERINALHHSAIQQLSKETNLIKQTNNEIKEEIRIIKEKLNLN